MALVKCKECNTEVSESAKSCPKCGYAGIIADQKAMELEKIKQTTGYKITLAIFLVFFFYTLMKCVGSFNKHDSLYNLCVEKGIRYFQSIGSYPKLSDGTDAQASAKSRCSNTTGAFDGLNK